MDTVTGLSPAETAITGSAANTNQFYGFSPNPKGFELTLGQGIVMEAPSFFPDPIHSKITVLIDQPSGSPFYEILDCSRNLIIAVTSQQIHTEVIAARKLFHLIHIYQDRLAVGHQCHQARLEEDDRAVLFRVLRNKGEHAP
jgi:hypothetical protein